MSQKLSDTQLPKMVQQDLPGHTIGGNGDVEVNGSGILNLTSANTYQGDTRIGAGSTLAAYADDAIGFGEVIVSDNATLVIDGSQQTVADVRNYGDILMADGVLNAIGETFIDHTARLRGTGRVDGRVRNLGSVEASAGGLEFTGDVVGDGSFSGENLFSGTYGPGNSPALVTHGNTTFGSSSVLAMELGGLLRGSEYDAINALTLNLNGVLKVDLIDIGMGTFMPSLGNTFDLLMANSISGMFSDFNFTGATLASGLTWSWNVFNNGASDIFRLMVVAVPPVGAPAPGALAILVIGIAGFAAARRRRT